MNQDRGEAELSFSLVKGGPIYSLFRRAGIIRAGELGIHRRILLVWVLIAVPVIVLALAAGQLVPTDDIRNALIRHFSVLARMLVAIPIFIATDVAVESFTVTIGQRLRATGILSEAQIPRFRDAVRRAERLRDSRIAFAAVVALAAISVASRLHPTWEWQELSWAVVERGGQPALSPAGYWYVIAGFGLYLLLGLQWIWRLFVLLILFWEIARLDLSLVPTHPDRAGGLGFLQQEMVVFSPIGFAVSAVLSARWSHDILYRGFHVAMLQVSMITFLVIAVAMLVAPLVVFAPALIRLRRTALRDYSPFISRQGRLVHKKWVLGEEVPAEESGVLSAPELGPLVDISSLYQGLQAIRPVPLNPRSLIALAVIIGLPILPVLTLEIPLREILKGLTRSV
ncbi:MAG TPA: hypothetical protein PLA43_13625 [Bryobacteraceae bacterium]|nr:hypothetical protein [Bryobacteraceae bacterium]HOL72876.1 hypothetical protein [Bryobacteraceae bacterium]HOQ46868.1 hypothetical protein [Bryobacteraceae bacterium]HPQ16498.1 hypothetical protein [Bryobacteraceae bacterium]HPU72993.1 hypothetical protein [Bryobacteraceae bacterium]